MKYIPPILKKKSVVIGGGIIIVILLIIIFSGGNDTPDSIAVKRGNVISEVSITGTVKPSQSLDMAFERGGKVDEVRVSVGEEVKRGDILITLENDDLYAQRAQAQAQYSSQLSRLEDLRKGSREEDLAVYESRLETARNTLVNTEEKAVLDLRTAYRSALNALQDAYGKAEDAVRNKTNDMFQNDESETPSLTFTSSDSSAAIAAGSGRRDGGKTLDLWRSEIDALSVEDTHSIDRILTASEMYLSNIISFYNNLEKALNNATGLTESTYTTYKTYLTTGRASLVSALTSVTSQQRSIAAQKTANQTAVDAAENAVTQAEKDLALRSATATNEDLSYQQAQVDQAYASIRYYTTQIEKNILRAPFDGLVTKIAFKEGEIVTAQHSAVSVIGSGTYQIEAYVTESDIARIQEGASARVTLDAYGRDVLFSATLSHIDLSETIIDGVATYKTVLTFNENDQRIKSGLTANIDILYGEKEDTLYVPTRSIFSQDQKQYVKKIEGENVVDWEVVTGLRGSDGRTEILEGLEEGDYVAI